jgi:hypothetical protein
MQVHVLTLVLMLAAAPSTAASGQGAPKIVVGDNPSLSGAPLYVALEKDITARPASTCKWR